MKRKSWYSCQTKISDIPMVFLNPSNMRTMWMVRVPQRIPRIPTTLLDCSVWEGWVLTNTRKIPTKVSNCEVEHVRWVAFLQSTINGLRWWWWPSWMIQRRRGGGYHTGRRGNYRETKAIKPRELNRVCHTNVTTITAVAGEERGHEEMRWLSTLVYSNMLGRQR